MRLDSKHIANSESVNDGHLALVPLFSALPFVVLSPNKAHTEADSPSQSDLLGVPLVHWLLI